MISIFKKHYICISVITFLLGAVVYGVLWYQDVTDWRYYPIDLTQKSQMQFEYKTGLISDTKYFKLFFYFDIKEREMERQYREAYYTSKSPYLMTNDELQTELKEKKRPEVQVRIYKDNQLIFNEKIIFIDVASLGENKKKHFLKIAGYMNNKKPVSYKFSPFTTYKIEVENKEVMEDIKANNIEVQLSIHSAPIR